MTKQINKESNAIHQEYQNDEQQRPLQRQLHLFSTVTDDSNKCKISVAIGFMQFDTG